MRKVIITGGIGSGKSTVGNLLKELGVRVIDADEIAHQLLEIFQNDIVNLFGSHILKDGKIERKKLGNIIFNDKEKLTALEKFLHPKIAKIMLSEFNTCIKDHILAVLDIPLYFEKLENRSEEGRVGKECETRGKLLGVP